MRRQHRNSYFGKGGEYIPNIKECNNKIAKAKAETQAEAKKNIRTTQHSSRKKLYSDVKSYSGGGTACSNNTAKEYLRSPLWIIIKLKIQIKYDVSK